MEGTFKDIVVPLVVSAIMALSGVVRAQDPNAPAAAASPAEKDVRMGWWREARFGLFIHWGLYAIPAGRWQNSDVNNAGEWIMQTKPIPAEEYEQLASQFNPVKFDADAWVALAKDAGMKYIVITSKHHDGFCLWDSKVSSYDVMDAAPFKRDILKELAAACGRQGVRLCFYHSIMDWHHPDAQRPFYPNYNDTSKSNPNFSRYVADYLKPQLKELVMGYGPLGVMWFDGEWIRDWNPKLGWETYSYVRSLQSDIIINNRVGKGRMGMQGMDAIAGRFAGDFGTPEQEIPAAGLPGVDWETCMTMNDTWGYKAADHNWKSTAELIHNLVDIASKGGNFLLNVGPKADGTIPDESIERLRQIGDWMKVNSESIYGTSPSTIGKPDWGRCTTGRGKIYLHVFDWPADGKLVVPQTENLKVRSAYALAGKAKVNLSADKNATLDLAGVKRDPIDTVVVLETTN